MKKKKKKKCAKAHKNRKYFSDEIIKKLNDIIIAIKELDDTQRCMA